MELLRSRGARRSSVAAGLAVFVALGVGHPRAAEAQTATSTATRTHTPTATATRTPTGTATRTATITATPTVTATATRTATATPTATTTRTPTATTTATITRTPTVTATGTTTATATPTATRTATATATVTATITPTATATATGTVTPTATPTTTATATATVTATATRTATATATSTATATPTATATGNPTATVTATATATGTPTVTATATLTPSATATGTATATPTATATGNPTATVTATATGTPTVTATVTATGTPTVTRTPTATVTATVTPTATSVPGVTPTPTARPVNLELSHGYRDLRNLGALGGVAVRHEFRVSQKPYSSYEVVVDATSGDIGPGLVLRRINGVGATVQESVGVGAQGFSRVLRWANDTPGQIDSELVRVHSGSCWTDCGSDDVYRVRAYDTTYSAARFNNSGTQTTIVMLENPTERTVDGRIHFWNTAGGLIFSEPFTLAPRGARVVPTSSLPALANQGGSLTVTHNAGYGLLAGKAVALEPSTGLSFDTLLLPRAR